MAALVPTGSAGLDRALLAGVRLVFSDLDETLLSPEHRVGERSRQAIAALMAGGVTFVVCTGRAPEATRPIVRALGGRYFVCNNGASVYDGDGLLAEQTLPAELAGEMTAFFHGHGIPTYLMTPAGYYVSRMTPLVAAANRVRGIAPQVLGPAGWTQPAHKVMPWGGAHLYAEAQARWGDRAHVIYHADYLEIAPPGVSKAWGARVVAERLGVPARAIAAVGDARNDIELVRMAGVGVAMGNADPLLKEAALAVAGHHADDGAADLFEAILAAQQ